MRAVLFGVLAVGFVGCGGKNDGPPPGPPDVKLVTPDPKSDPRVVPVVTPHAAPKSAIKIDYPALWDKSGPKRLTVEEQAERLIGLLHYQAHSDECFAAQMVGAGMAGPVALAVRIKVQPIVVKSVKDAADKPLIILGLGGLRGSMETSSGRSGKKTVVIGVTDPPAEAKTRVVEFTAAVSASLKEAGAIDPPSEPLAGGVAGTRIKYALPDRAGTVTIALLPPKADKKTIDAVIPADDLIRTLLSGDEAESTLVIVVDEK